MLEGLTVADLEIIGDLFNVKVLIDRDTQSVIIAHDGYMPPIKFSIDHPYIQGTRLERDARRALSLVSEDRGADQ
jgi:hypothetical protein